MAARDLSLDQVLPGNIDAERFVLGAIMSSENAFLQVAGSLTAEDFSLEKHKRIYLRMMDLHERGDRIDRVTLANELMKQGQLQSVDGLSYLVSLDDGLPRIENLGAYIGIVKEKATLRKIVQISNDAANQCLEGASSSREILGSVEESLLRIGSIQQAKGLMSPAEIINDIEGGINTLLNPRRSGGG